MYLILAKSEAFMHNFTLKAVSWGDGRAEEGTLRVMMIKTAFLRLEMMLIILTALLMYRISCTV